MFGVGSMSIIGDKFQHEAVYHIGEALVTLSLIGEHMYQQPSDEVHAEHGSERHSLLVEDCRVPLNCCKRVHAVHSNHH